MLDVAALEDVQAFCLARFVVAKDLERRKQIEWWMSPREVFEDLYAEGRVKGDCDDYVALVRQVLWVTPELVTWSRKHAIVLPSYERIENRIIYCTVPQPPDREGHVFVVEARGWAFDNNHRNIVARDELEARFGYQPISKSGWNIGDPWTKAERA